MKFTLLPYFLFIFPFAVYTQTKVIDNKGTIKTIDESKWMTQGNNILSKNTENVGIGVAEGDTPARKLEIKASEGTPPLRFTNMTSTSATLPTASGSIYPLYVDENGDVIAKKRKTVTNELYFEDTDYHYVSMKINTNDYLVVRYTKSNVNEEKNASATDTAQPNTLTAVQALTYN